MCTDKGPCLPHTLGRIAELWETDHWAMEPETHELGPKVPRIERELLVYDMNLGHLVARLHRDPKDKLWHVVVTAQLAAAVLPAKRAALFFGMIGDLDKFVLGADLLAEAAGGFTDAEVREVARHILESKAVQGDLNSILILRAMDHASSAPGTDA